MDEYLIPDSDAESKIVIKNSRFIGRAAYTSSVKKAKEFIQTVASSEPGHSHAVYGYIIGFGNTVTHGMSDAGEPQGTAGRPVLEVLKGSGIGDITLVVIRYFGGTKLGTGGLVKAYTQSAQETLSKLKVKKKINTIQATLVINYQHYDIVEKIITQYNGKICEKSFGTNVCCQVLIPEKEYSGCIVTLKNATNGKIDIKEI